MMEMRISKALEILRQAQANGAAGKLAEERRDLYQGLTVTLRILGDLAEELERLKSHRPKQGT